jgi:hypothetical protein
VALTSRLCPIIHTRVTVETDLEDNVTNVCCRYHVRQTHACRMKPRAASGGRLSELLEHAATGRFTDQTVRCLFH